MSIATPRRMISSLATCAIRIFASGVDRRFDETYQLAADMGGAGFIFTGENDADIMHNSATINLNVLDVLHNATTRGSSIRRRPACIRPTIRKTRTIRTAPKTAPIRPRPTANTAGRSCLASACSGLRPQYGMHARRALPQHLRARRHLGRRPREGARRALPQGRRPPRAAGPSKYGATASRPAPSFIVDECVEGTLRLMRSDVKVPVNIGSEEMVTIGRLADLISEIAGKHIEKTFVTGPQGVRGRNSDNHLIRSRLNWAPSRPLRDGLVQTYKWISEQVAISRRSTTRDFATH